MKKTLALFAVVLAMGLSVTLDAEAKRLGGGKSLGMQRSTPTQPAHPPANNATNAPAQTAPAAGTAAAAPNAAAAAAAPKRSWLGPVAGIAAGLGIAALMSHLGFGEAMANIMTMLLIGMAVLFVISYFMRKRAQAQQPAYASVRQEPPMSFRSNEQAPAYGGGGSGGSLIGSKLAGPVDTQPRPIPDGFDTAAFERNARDQFMALQSANDAGDVQRLRDYLSPAMFELASADIAERGGAAQKTEVFGLNAQVLEVAEDDGQYVVSVRFTGSVREERAAMPEDLDEVWHLTKPRAGFGGWVIAGIQQVPPQQH